MDKYKSAVQSLVLGAILILCLFAFAYLIYFGIIPRSAYTESLAPVVFGLGGSLFLIIGIFKAIVASSKKQ